MIIGLTGFARTGKDSFADGLVEQEGFFKIGFAGALKELTEKIDPYLQGRIRLSNSDLGEDAIKEVYPEYRRILKALGNGVRDIDPLFWVHAAEATMARHVERGCHEDFVFTDVRFPNEAAVIRLHGGYLVRLTREGYGPESDFERYVDEIAVDAVVGGPDVPALHALVAPTLGALALVPR